MLGQENAFLSTLFEKRYLVFACPFLQFFLFLVGYTSFSLLKNEK